MILLSSNKFVVFYQLWLHKTIYNHEKNQKQETIKQMIMKGRYVISKLPQLKESQLYKKYKWNKRIYLTYLLEVKHNNQTDTIVHSDFPLYYMWLRASATWLWQLLLYQLIHSRVILLKRDILPKKVML